MKQENLNEIDIKTIISLLDVEPMFNKVIITLNKLEPDGSLVLSDEVLSDEQYILAKGSMVKDVEVGQKVLLDLDKLSVKQINPNNQYDTISNIKIDPYQFHDYTFAIIEDRSIKAKFKI